MTPADYRAAILAAEARASAGIARDLEGLRGVADSGYAHGWGPTYFIESRWIAWLDAHCQAIEDRYYAELDESEPQP